MSEAKKLRILSHQTMRETLKRQTYLVKGLIPRWGVGMVWGPPQTMKTFWVLDVALHVHLGIEYQGRKVHRGDVVYCPFEGTSGIVNRLDAFCIGHGLDCIPEGFAVLADPLKFTKRAADGHGKLIESIHDVGLKPVLVVLDTLHQSITGSENNDEDMGFYLGAALDISRSFECFTLIVHHTGKVGTDPRGHSSARGDVDLLLATSRSGERGTDSDMVTVRVEKMKDGKEGVTTHSWVRIANIGTDEDGDAITSCYLVPAPEPASTPPGLKDRGQASKALAILQHLIEQHGRCTLDMWKTECLRGRLSKGMQAAQLKAFRRACDDLREKGLIRLRGALVEIVDPEDEKNPN